MLRLKTKENVKLKEAATENPTSWFPVTPTVLLLRLVRTSALTCPF